MSKDQSHQIQMVLAKLRKYRQAVIAILDDEPIDVYLFLRDRFEAVCDCRGDRVFQFLFRSFYRLDNAGLSDDFKTAYFSLLQMNREAENVDLAAICRELSHHETKRGNQSLQFSFATKLAATINVNLPIYDSLVADVFEFNPPCGIKEFDKRLDRFMSFYGMLQQIVNSLVNQADLNDPSTVLATKIGNWSKVPKIKQVDFILWAAGKALQWEQAAL
jgi:hypothetical protein